MRYFGGKQRIAKPLCEFLNASLSEGQIFIDLFCGSCNVVSNIRQDVKRYANDKNKYLPTLFKCLQQGMILPDDISAEDYYRIKEMPECSSFVSSPSHCGNVNKYVIGYHSTCFFATGLFFNGTPFGTGVFFGWGILLGVSIS